MKNLVEIKNSEPRVSHRIIADNTDNKQDNIIQTISKNLLDFEEFGDVEVELKKVQTAGGVQKQKTFWLNEAQATLLMTYLRNSDVVRNFKKALVREFFEMRERIYDGKSVHHVISGLKSGLASKDRKIEELQLTIERLRITVREQGITLQALEDKSNRKDDIEKAIEHNNMLEILFQMQAFKNDLEAIETAFHTRRKAVTNWMNVFENNYERCKNYIDELQIRDDIGSFRSKF